MKLETAQSKFIQTWGTLASQWGINKTMAQVHALLLSTASPLSTENIMEKLQISRGNANMNLRALMDWGVVAKVYQSGERKDFFVAEKDSWEIFKRIAEERKRREIDPVLKTLEELTQINDSSIEAESFKATIKDLLMVTKRTNTILEKAIKLDESWLINLLKKKK